MLKNSVKLSRRYPLALMLLTALSVVSCGVTRETTTAQTQINSSSAVSTDSTAVTNTAVNGATKSQLDSLLQATIQQVINQEYEESREQTLHFVIFDTTQPTDTVTGLPPVRAAITKTETSARNYKSQETAQTDIQKEVHAQQVDSTSVQHHSETTLLRHERDSLSVRNETATEKIRERQPWKTWLHVGLFVALAFMAVVLYLRKKLKL
nr:MAG TPA: hypothetical protein [Caudoviricetes sp.]